MCISMLEYTPPLPTAGQLTVSDHLNMIYHVLTYSSLQCRVGCFIFYDLYHGVVHTNHLPTYLLT